MNPSNPSKILNTSLIRNKLIFIPNPIDEIYSFDIKPRLKDTLELTNYLSEMSVVLNSSVIYALLNATDKNFVFYKNAIKSRFIKQNGTIFRDGFGSSNNIADEAITLEEMRKQMNHYFVSYGLGLIINEEFENKRAFEVDVDLNKNKSLNGITVIDIIEYDDYLIDIIAIMTSPIVFGSLQRKELESLYNADKEIFLKTIGEVSNSIKVKENFMSIFEMVKEDLSTAKMMVETLKTSTDLLRVAYSVSNLEYLSPNPKFRVSTAWKKMIFKKLQELKLSDDMILNDMKPLRNEWLSLAKNIHPLGKKSNLRVKNLFKRLRADDIITFNAISERFKEKGDMIGLAKHLSSKAGLFLRSLDYVIRNSDKKSTKEIAKILENTPLNPKLIVNLRKRLEYRSENHIEKRYFKVKGKLVLIDNKPLPKLDKEKTKRFNATLKVKLIDSLKNKELF